MFLSLGEKYMSDYDKNVKASLENKFKCISNKNIVISPNYLKKSTEKLSSHYFLNSSVPYQPKAEPRSVSKEKWIAKKTFI